MMWRLAFRNLFRNKRRTAATGAAVVAGFVGLTLLGGYLLRVEASLRANEVYLMNKGHVSIYKKEGLQRYSTKPAYYQIKPEDFEVLQKELQPFQNEIQWVGRAMTGAGLISNGEKSVPFLATGVDLNTLEKSYSHPEVMKWARDFLTQDSLDFVSAIKQNPLSISVTSRLGELIKRKTPFQSLSPEERSVQLAGMNFFSDLNAVDAVLSVSHTTGSGMLEDSGLRAPLELLQQLYGSDGCQYVMIYLKNHRQIKKIVAELNKIFRDKDLNFEAYPFNAQEISPNYVGSMGFLYAMAGFFVFLICGAVALSIVNSLTMGILERTREIGTFRAIGYQPQQISWMMAQESLWLCLLSGMLGTLFAALIAATVNSLNVRFNPPGVPNSVQFVLTPNPTLVLMIFVLFLFLVGLTSYGVTHFKLKMKIVDLLSDSGA